MEDLEFTAAPRENLATWDRIKGIILWSAISIFLFLGLLALLVL